MHTELSAVHSYRDCIRIAFIRGFLAFLMLAADIGSLVIDQCRNAAMRRLEDAQPTPESNLVLLRAHAWKLARLHSWCNAWPCKIDDLGSVLLLLSVLGEACAEPCLSTQ